MYEYLCAHCGKRFELIQKFSDAPLTVHEECGSGPVERLISAPALHFKGTGWYVTDYAKKGNGSAGSSLTESKEKSEGGPKSESPKSDGSKTDGAKSESTKSSESTKAEGSKSDSSKSETSKPDSSSSKDSSPAPAPATSTK